MRKIRTETYVGFVCPDMYVNMFNQKTTKVSKCFIFSSCINKPMRVVLPK